MIFPPDPPGSVRWHFVNDLGEIVPPGHSRPSAPPPPQNALTMSALEYEATKKRLIAEAQASLTRILPADLPDARTLTDAEYRAARAQAIRL